MFSLLLSFLPSNNHLILFRSLLHREAESHTLYIRDLMPPPRSILSRPASPGCFPSKSRGVALAMPNTAPWLQPLRTCQTSASPTGSSQRKRVRGEVRVAEGQGGGAAGAALGGSIPLPSVAAAAEPELLREARTQEVDPVRRHAWWQGGAAVRAGGAPGSRCLSVGRRAWGAKAWGARGAARDGERGAGPRRRRHLGRYSARRPPPAARSARRDRRAPALGARTRSSASLAGTRAPGRYGEM